MAPAWVGPGGRFRCRLGPDRPGQLSAPLGAEATMRPRPVHCVRVSVYFGVPVPLLGLLKGNRAGGLGVRDLCPEMGRCDWKWGPAGPGSEQTLHQSLCSLSPPPGPLYSRLLKVLSRPCPSFSGVPSPPTNSFLKPSSKDPPQPAQIPKHNHIGDSLSNWA